MFFMFESRILDFDILKEMMEIEIISAEFSANMMMMVSQWSYSDFALICDMF